MEIDHVVVPLSQASFLTAVAPKSSPASFARVHAPEVPPRVNVTVSSPSSSIESWSLEKVDETEPMIWLEISPAVAPLEYSAIAITSPAERSEASVTSSQPLDTPAAVTVTIHCAVLLPSTDVAVIVAWPAATPVTTPPLTVATLESLVDQVTFLFVALDGEIEAVNVTVLPALIVAEAWSREIDVTETALTWILNVAWTVVELAASAVAVIVVLPTLTPVIKPSLLTVALLVLSEENVTFLTFVVLGS